MLSTRSLKRDQRVEKRTGKIQMVMNLLTGHMLTSVRSSLTVPLSGVEERIKRAKVRKLMGHGKHSLITEGKKKIKNPYDAKAITHHQQTDAQPVS